MGHHERVKQLPQLLPRAQTSTPPSSTAVMRPKKNSTACLACKHAKRKCSGPPHPCKACANAHQACVFDPSRDRRRKVGVKRTIQELQNYKMLLDKLLDSLRSLSQQDIERVMKAIQSNVPYHELARAVGCAGMHFAEDPLAEVRNLDILDDGDQHLELPNTGQLDMSIRRLSDSTTQEDSSTTQEEVQNEEWTQRLVPGPYARVTLERIFDVPVLNVPAKTWTTVTNDSELVSHLVSLYFTWDHPSAQLVDQNHFLAHMKSDNESSEFCTPLLVNILLAMASTYSDRPDVSTLVDAFLDEADRLWKVEEGYPTLANVQSLLLMCRVLQFQGKLRLSWLVLRQAVELARDMCFFQATPFPNSFESAPSPEMTSARQITAWAIFNLNAQMAIELQKAPNLQPPVPYAGLGSDEDVSWTPYPRLKQSVYPDPQAELPAVRQKLIILTNITMRHRELFFGNDFGLNASQLWDRGCEALVQLRQFLEGWDEKWSFEKRPVPQILIVRMKCHQAIMRICQTVIERSQRGPQLSPKQLQSILSANIDSAADTAHCLHIQRRLYGLNTIPSQMVDVTQAALKAMVYSQLEESQKAKLAFIELSRFGTAFSERFKTMANTIRDIRLMILNQEIVLPPEAVAILDGSESPETGDGDGAIVDSASEHGQDR